MEFILLEIIKGSFIVLLIYFLSYIIEKNTGFKFLIWSIKRKQNQFMALGAANTAALIFFLINIIVLLYDLDTVEIKPKGYSFIKWLIIIIPLTIILRKIHLKLSLIDKDRNNFDFSD